MSCNKIVSQVNQNTLTALTTFTLVILMAGCNNPESGQTKPPVRIKDLPEKTCIERVIKADEYLGAKRDNACKNLPLSQAIKGYAEGMGKLDFQNCSEQFTNAFHQHKEAWIDMVAVTNNYSTLRGEMHELFALLEKGSHAEEFKKHLKQITETWVMVEKARNDKR